MADKYLNYLLAQRASPSALSKSPFVAVGSDMWSIWQSILRRQLHGRVAAAGDPPRNTSSYPTPRAAQLDRAQEISTIKWLPSEDDPFPNPWFDTASLLPANGRDQQARRFPFNLLPLDLVVYLATFLPTASAVALALTNKTMYRLLYGQPFDMQAPVRFDMTTVERWNLLLLLERDSNVLAACQECMKLHGPLRRAGLACVERSRTFLPGDITPVFCRLLAKRYIHQENYVDLLGMANRTQISTQPDFKLFTTVTYHLRAGNLFARQETFIAPLTVKRELTGRGAYLLNKAVDSERSNVCPHVRWQHLGLELSCCSDSGIHYPSSLSAYYLGTQLSGKRDGLFGNDLSQELTRMDGLRILEFSRDCRYATAHCKNPHRHDHYHMSGGCYNSTVIPYSVLDSGFGPGLKCALLHSQPCEDCDKCPTRFRINLVRACEICATDMCVSAQDVEGIGRVMALTTWRNLGGVHVGQWATWYSHYWNINRFSSRFLVEPEDAMVLRDLSKGTAVYAAFHSLPVGTELPVRWYTPSIPRRMLDAFREGLQSSEKWWKLPELVYLKAPSPGRDTV